MQRRTIRSFTLLLIFASFVLLACDFGSLVAGKPTVVISSPPSGSQFREGEDVSVQSTSTDSSGITRVELIVDGTVVRTDPVPAPQVSYPLIQTWKATAGAHTLTVRAYNNSNNASDPAAVTITVLTASGQAVGPTTIANVETPAIPTVVIPTVAPGTDVPGTCTNNAAYVSDVTVPDGTILAPGQTFNKIWRMRNNGTCAWETGYQFVFVGGEAMTTSTSILVPYTAPGATADMLVPMTAPTGGGTHTGQWRMKASDAAFGTTVTVNIKVQTTPPSPTPTRTPSGCSGNPNIASFTATSTTITAGSSTTLQWGAVTNANTVEIDQGIGGVGTPDDAVVSPGSTTTYTMTARCGSAIVTRQVTITVNSAAPPVPAQSAPVDGTVFRVAPRVATFSWGAVSFSGGVTYGIEIQINTGTWQAFALQTGIAGTSYAMAAFPGDNQGRWRVWANNPSAGDSAKSGWRSFSFNTSAAQYSATWLNNDSATSGIKRIVISNSGQTLNVNPVEKCGAGECDWLTKSGTFNGEPFVITGFPSGGTHQLSITLSDPGGTTLRAVDSGGGGGTFTFYFHK
jgi:hypothetical protein